MRQVRDLALDVAEAMSSIPVHHQLVWCAGASNTTVGYCIALNARLVAERLTRLVRQVHLNTAVVAVHGRHGSGSKPSVEFRRVVDHARQTPASASPIIAAADQQETDNNGKTTQTMWGRMDNAALGPVQREFFDEVVLATPVRISIVYCSSFV